LLWIPCRSVFSTNQKPLSELLVAKLSKTSANVSGQYTGLDVNLVHVRLAGKTRSRRQFAAFRQQIFVGSVGCLLHSARARMGFRLESGSQLRERRQNVDPAVS
jgi:hypothetical protein